MTVSILNWNKWLWQTLGRLGGSSCSPEKGRGAPPAEDRRAGGGPLHIVSLIIQDNRNPWLLKRGPALHSQAFLYPHELLAEWDANVSPTNPPKTRTPTASMKSASRQLKGPFSGLNCLPCSFYCFSLPLAPLFALLPSFPSFHLHHKNNRLLLIYQSTKQNTWVIWVGSYEEYWNETVCAVGLFPGDFYPPACRWAQLTHCAMQKKRSS